MPYIIETTTPCRAQFGNCKDPDHADISRIAVATLDEARDAVAEMVYDDGTAAQDALAVSAYDIPADGGTIGPLPDGTVIEVRQVAPADLARMAGIRPHMFDPDNPVPLVAAFNSH